MDFFEDFGVLPYRPEFPIYVISYNTTVKIERTKKLENN